MIAIESLPYSAHGDEAAAARPIGARCASGRGQPSAARIPAPLRDDRAARPGGTVPPTRTVRLGAQMTLPRASTGSINDETPPPRRAREGRRAAGLGRRQRDRMDHPFHLHGFFFQVIAIDGAAAGAPVVGGHVNVAREEHA